MENLPIFATIDLPDDRQIIVRRYMPAEKLKLLAALAKNPGFSKQDLAAYTEFDVSIIPPSLPFKPFLFSLN